MSSPEYSTSLRPDPRLRRIVVAVGVALVAGGAAAVTVLPLSAGSRAVLLLLWVAAGTFEIAATLAAFRRCLGIRIAAGGAAVVRDRSRGSRAAELLPGSLVTTRYAWLRLRAAGGLRYTEPACGDGRQSEEWRRLQVIWRHIGASR